MFSKSYSILFYTIFILLYYYKYIFYYFYDFLLISFYIVHKNTTIKKVKIIFYKNYRNTKIHTKTILILTLINP